jgi:tetratricopeptide (TPR) repeat protein
MSLASTYLAAGNLPASEAAVDELLGEFPTDRWGSLLAVMVHRKLGRIDAAKELLECLLLADPLWGRLRSEAMLLDMPAEMGGGKRHLSDDAVTSALPYLELGQWADAARILAVPESNDGFGDALRLSHLAYALHRAGDPAGAQKALAAITPQSIQSAHPWSAVSMDALTELARLYPACGPVEAMRGNYLAFNNQIDVAAAAWKKAVELGVKHTAVYGNLAAAAAAKHQIDEAIGYYQQAWDLSDGDLHLLSEFDRLLATAKRNDQREALYKQLPPAKQARPFAAARRVVQLMDTCRYEEALREMETHEFYSAEGERTIHVQYMETLLALALPKIAAGDYAAARTLLLRAVEYPRNLNIGRRLGGSGESIVRYYLGLTESLAGNTAQAREHLLAAAHENHFDGEFTQAFELLAWKGLGECFRTIGLSRRIEAIAAKRPTNTGWVEEWWWQTGPLQTAALGLVQLAKGRPAEAKKIWADVLAKDPATRWVRLLVDTPDAMLKQMMDLNVAVR